jgi:Uma2 family endonuclease
MSITINPPEGPWTIADLATLPDVGYRFEVHQGNLVMMSPVTIWHSRVMRRLTQALVAQGSAAEMEVGVRRGSRNMRLADVAVFKAAPKDPKRAYWLPGDLTLVVEIVSESSADDDRTAKPRWYAQAGIPRTGGLRRAMTARPSSSGTSSRRRPTARPPMSRTA